MRQIEDSALVWALVPVTLAIDGKPKSPLTLEYTSIIGGGFEGSRIFERKSSPCVFI